MTIDVNGVSVSIPTFISEWIKENDDNRTEFYGMLDSFIFAIKSFYEKKNKPNPYDKIYEEQISQLMSIGFSREDAEKEVCDTIEKAKNATDKKWEENGTARLLEILQKMKNQ